MPRKIRELISDLKRAGFRLEPGRGSHRKFIHPQGLVAILSGHSEGADAKAYQEKQVREQIERTKQ